MISSNAVNIVDVFRLAEDRGCTLKITMMDDMLMYWVESHYFVGRPYSQVDELITFIEALPVLGKGESMLSYSF